MEVVVGSEKESCSQEDWSCSLATCSQKPLLWSCPCWEAGLACMDHLVLHGSEDEVMADEGTLLCQMKFVTNSHLLISRSYKVCACTSNYLLYIFKHEI